MAGCWKYGKGTSRLHKMQGIFCLWGTVSFIELVILFICLFGWLVGWLVCFFISLFLPSFPSFLPSLHSLPSFPPPFPPFLPFPSLRSLLNSLPPFLPSSIPFLPSLTSLPSSRPSLPYFLPSYPSFHPSFLISLLGIKKYMAVKKIMWRPFSQFGSWKVSTYLVWWTRTAVCFCKEG